LGSALKRGDVAPVMLALTCVLGCHRPALTTERDGSSAGGTGGVSAEPGNGGSVAGAAGAIGTAGAGGSATRGADTGDAGGAGGAGGSDDPCTNHDIDIRAAIVTGSVTINGAPLLDSTNYGQINLYSPMRDLGTIYPVAFTYTGSYAVRVVPGSYDVTYWGHRSAGLLAPQNPAVIVGSLVVADPGPSTADIDIRSAVLSGSVTINGSVLGTASDYGTIHLRDANGVDLTIGDTITGSFMTAVVPGNYDIWYQLGPGGRLLPINRQIKIASVVVADPGPTTETIDMESVVVTGSITINGLVSSATDYGFVGFKNPTDAIFFASTADGSYSIHIVPGNYDVYYSAYSPPGVTSPRNKFVKVGSAVIAYPGPTIANIDVRSVPVTVSATFNGVAGSASDDGQLSLRGQDGDNFPVGYTHEGPSTIHVVPGSYEIWYQGAQSSGLAPFNLSLKVGSVVVADPGPTTVTVDIRSAPLTLSATINGVPAGSATDYGNLELHSGPEDIVYMGKTFGGPYTHSVVPGTYDVYYAGFSMAGTPVPADRVAPVNARIKIGSVVVADPGPTTATFDIRSVPVTGTVTINGAVAGSATDYGVLYLRDKDGDSNADHFPIASTSWGSYATPVVRGSYDLYFSNRSGGDAETVPPIGVAPSNVDVKLRCFVVP
jgi:hypothetical protein